MVATVRVADSAPIAVGWNETVIVHWFGLFSVPVQVVVYGKSPLFAPPGVMLNVRASSPALAIVTVCEALVVFTNWFPKASEVGVTDPATLTEFGDSTAPISICVPFTSGRGLPKKSVVGASAYVGDEDDMASIAGDPDNGT